MQVDRDRKSSFAVGDEEPGCTCSNMQEATSISRYLPSAHLTPAQQHVTESSDLFDSMYNISWVVILCAEWLAAWLSNNHRSSDHYKVRGTHVRASGMSLNFHRMQSLFERHFSCPSWANLSCLQDLDGAIDVLVTSLVTRSSIRKWCACV